MEEPGASPWSAWEGGEAEAAGVPARGPLDLWSAEEQLRAVCKTSELHHHHHRWSPDIHPEVPLRKRRRRYRVVRRSGAASGGASAAAASAAGVVPAGWRTGSPPMRLRSRRTPLPGRRVRQPGACEAQTPQSSAAEGRRSSPRTGTSLRPEAERNRLCAHIRPRRLPELS